MIEIPQSAPKGSILRTESAFDLMERVKKVATQWVAPGHTTVVVLTNLAELQGTSIEHCIDTAYNEIKDRTCKMDNGTFKKD